MPINIQIIKKKIEFINISKHGKKLRSDNMILQKLCDQNLNSSIKVGYKVTKLLGNAVKRNRAKRIMRELVRRNIKKYGEINFFYVLIAKKGLFDSSFKNLEQELIKLLIKK